MSVFTSASTFRRLTAGCALVTGPLLFAAAEILAPEQVDGDRQQFAEFAAHRGALLASSFFSIASALVLIPGFLGLVHLVRRRGVTYANIAALLLGYGLIAAHAALGGVSLVFAEMVAPGLNHAAMYELFHSMMHDVGLGAPLLAGHYIFVIGLILLGVAIWRGRVGPTWASVCVLLFPISDVLLSNVHNAAVSDIVSNVFSVVGFGALGLYLLTMSNHDWDAANLAEATTASVPNPATLPQ
jgi:hypothetical protein